MELKLAQRLLTHYYKTKFRTLALVSPRKAAEAALDLFCTPFDHKIPKKAPVSFHKAKKLSFGSGETTIRGFCFAPASPNGKKILVAHGFRSYTYRFESYITALQKQGFEVYAFDAPAHGLSTGKRINAYIYKNALHEAERLYGPFYGMMGHSLGGLSASLAFEEMDHSIPRKLVLVAPAETESAIDNFFRILQIDEKIRSIFTDLIQELTGHPASYFSTARAVQRVHSPVLWVHDKHDLVCPFKDVAPLLSLGLPHVTYRITEHLGHSRVYKDEGVRKEIVAFF